MKNSIVQLGNPRDAGGVTVSECIVLYTKSDGMLSGGMDIILTSKGVGEATVMNGHHYCTTFLSCPMYADAVYTRWDVSWEEVAEKARSLEQYGRGLDNMEDIKALIKEHMPSQAA